MRISDWSSDVCSSDLPFAARIARNADAAAGAAAVQSAPLPPYGAWLVPGRPLAASENESRWRHAAAVCLPGCVAEAHTGLRSLVPQPVAVAAQCTAPSGLPHTL